MFSQLFYVGIGLLLIYIGIIELNILNGLLGFYVAVNSACILFELKWGDDFFEK